MRASALYRTEAGRSFVLSLYRRKLENLTFPHDSRFVETRHGRTHVLMLGPKQAPPLIAIHGVNFAAPFMADTIGPLAKHFRIYIPDIIGQPGLSAEMQPPPAAHGYAGWLADVLDQLSLGAVAMMGVSFGGAVVLDLAATAPSRISKAVLVVPAGFNVATAPMALLLRLFLPWHAHRLWPDMVPIAAAVRPLAWEMDAEQYSYFDAILRHVRWLILPPGPFTTSDLEAFVAPTALFAARQDIFFPGDTLVAEARTVIPRLVEAHVFDSSHFPTSAMLAGVMERTQHFLTQDL
ncbi:MAG: alpha/beta fold hydrolase [Rhodospirillaceae bacterium]|nr:alpha/beta fold hydrolase [Rhodospirillaceae bacterium]